MRVRAIKKTEYGILEEFLFHALFVPPGSEAPEKDVIKKPELAMYIDGFGTKPGDCAVVAVEDKRIVGAAWTRIIPAYGHIDDDTPELAISVLPEFRNRGNGAKMLKFLFDQLVIKGYRQTSLSVQKENPAAHLYTRTRYKTLRENAEDIIMVRDLKPEAQSIGLIYGMCLGMGLGIAIGVATDNLPIMIGAWLAVGIAIGTILYPRYRVKSRK